MTSKIPSNQFAVLFDEDRYRAFTAMENMLRVVPQVHSMFVDGLAGLGIIQTYYNLCNEIGDKGHLKEWCKDKNCQYEVKGQKDA